jgi:hypothetical protein
MTAWKRFSAACSRQQGEIRKDADRKIGGPRYLLSRSGLTLRGLMPQG